jgi:acyl-CoA synthetase (AMP-forming)/AMP-acid ligase II
MRSQQAKGNLFMKVPFNVLDFLDRAEHVYGDRVGIVDEPDQPARSWGEMTWRQVAEHARAFAAGLDALGVGRGERVAIVSQNSARLLVALFGVSGYGRVVVPINFPLNAEEVAYIVEHSGASVLLVDPELDEALAGVTATHRFVLGEESDHVLLRFDRQPNPWVNPSEDALASINYTSGTTARPKGVELTHRNLYMNAMTFGWQTGVDDRDVYLWAVPMFHCNGWGLVYAITAMGGCHVILRKVDGPEILRRIERYGVTFMGGAPAVVNTILTTASEWAGPVPGRDRMRIVSGGAPPPSATIESVETDLGWEFIQVYGLTETSPLLTLNRRRAEWDTLSPAERARRIGRAGPPGIGARLRVDDQGEVLAQGNMVFSGYWQQPDETSKALVDGWFHTGDGGHLDDDGYLTISDRKKDVIITGGENVSSIEVEDCLYQHPAVAEAAVIGVPDEKWGETVKAIVVRKPGALVSADELMAHCRARLAHYKCPTSIDIEGSLARTATGKVQKFKLRERYWEGRQRLVN